jgi:AraC family transcriptional regulator
VRVKDEARGYAVGERLFRAIGTLILTIQGDLDAPWTLERMAELTDCEPHHFAHAFRAVVGVPALQYVRRLRLERAAHHVAYDDGAQVAALAADAGYASPDAFRRAFLRTFGRAITSVRDEVQGRRTPRPKTARTDDAPGRPATLVGEPVTEWLPRLHAASFPAARFEAAAIVAALARFTALAAKPTAPWGWGSITPPQGWATQSRSREFRWIRLVDAHAPPPAPPLRAWSTPAAWYARFDYDGPEGAFQDTYRWIFNTWLPHAGLRYAFAPTVTLLDPARWGSPVLERTHARLCVPVLPFFSGDRARP